MGSSDGHWQSIECGSASVQLRVDGDGLGTALYSGLLVPSNFLALSMLVMRAGVARQAVALLYRIEQAAICFTPQSLSSAYAELAPQLQTLPVAFVTNEGQAELHRIVVQRAGEFGLLRRQFGDALEARAWLLSTARAIGDNRDWWAQRRRPPAGSPPERGGES